MIGMGFRIVGDEVYCHIENKERYRENDKS